jgi:hypothetical protein
MRRWKWKGGVEERTGIQARNGFKERKAILGKVSHFLIQGSVTFCYFLKLTLPAGLDSQCSSTHNYTHTSLPAKRTFYFLPLFASSFVDHVKQ